MRLVGMSQSPLSIRQEAGVTRPSQVADASYTCVSSWFKCLLCLVFWSLSAFQQGLNQTLLWRQSHVLLNISHHMTGDISKIWSMLIMSLNSLDLHTSFYRHFSKKQNQLQSIKCFTKTNNNSNEKLSFQNKIVHFSAFVDLTSDVTFEIIRNTFHCGIYLACMQHQSCCDWLVQTNQTHKRGWSL